MTRTKIYQVGGGRLDFLLLQMAKTNLNAFMVILVAQNVIVHPFTEPKVEPSGLLSMPITVHHYRHPILLLLMIHKQRKVPWTISLLKRRI